MDLRLQLSLDEAIRASEEQRSTLDTLQDRAGVLLAFAGVLNLVLGQAAVGGRCGLPLPVVTIGGFIAAAAAAGLLLSVCWPRDLQHALPPQALRDREGQWNVENDDDLAWRSIEVLCEIRRSQESKIIQPTVKRLQWALVAVVANAAAFAIVAIVEEVR